MFTAVPNSSKVKQKLVRFLRAVLASILSIQYFLLFCVVELSANPNQGIQIDRSRSANTRVRNNSGSTVIDISTPSRSGVSRNAYSQFNVGSSGAVLNNSRKAGRSQLSGELSANPNLRGNAARVILNEVTGNSRSRLNGGIEIFGQRAEFILANSYGIDCDGCGFMNMSRATLTTGQIRMGKDGSLEGFDVKGGDIQIGEGGLDASGVSYFDLLTQKARINGRVKAQSFAGLLGNNRISYDNRGIEEELGLTGAGDGYALDITELGGVNADSIYMESTNKGMGVRVAGNMAASAGSITFTADGKMELKSNVSAGRGSVALESRSGNISIDSFAQISGDFVSLEAGNAIVNEGGFVEAHKHLHLRAGDEELLQSSLEDLDFVSSGEGDGPRGIINKGGGVLRSWGVVQLTSQWDIVNDDSEILANGWLELNAGQSISNTAGTLSAGIGYALINARNNIESGSWGRIEGVLGVRLEAKTGDIQNEHAHMFGGHSMQLFSGNDVINEGEWATIKSIKSVNIVAERDISIKAGLMAAGEDIILQAGRDLRVGQAGALKAVEQIYAFAEHEIKNEGLLLSGSRIDLITETGDVFNSGRIEVGEVDIMSILLEKYGGDGLIPRNARELQYMLSLTPDAAKSSSASYTMEEIEELFAIELPEGYEEEEGEAKLLIIRSGGGSISNIEGGVLTADMAILEAEKGKLFNAGLIEAKDRISLLLGKEIKELGEEENTEILAKVDEVLQKFAPSAPDPAPVAEEEQGSVLGETNAVQNTGDVLRALNDVIAQLESRTESGDASVSITDLESLRSERDSILSAEIGEDDERVVLSSGSLLNEGALAADTISMRIVGLQAPDALMRGSFTNAAGGSIIARSDGQSSNDASEDRSQDQSQGQGSGAVLDIDADGLVYNYGYISAGALMSIKSRNSTVRNQNGTIESDGDIIISAGGKFFNSRFKSGGEIRAGASLRIEAEEKLVNLGEAALSGLSVSLESKNSYIANLRGARIEGQDGVSLLAKTGIINSDFTMTDWEGRSQASFDARLDGLRAYYGKRQDNFLSTIESSAGAVSLAASSGSIDNSAGAIMGDSVYLKALGDSSGEGDEELAVKIGVDGVQGVINRRDGYIKAERSLVVSAGAGDLEDKEQKDRLFADASQALDTLYTALESMGLSKEELGLSFSEDAYSADAKGALVSVLRTLEDWNGREGLEAEPEASEEEGASDSDSLSLAEALLLEAGFEARDPLAESESPCAGHRASSIPGVLCSTVAKIKELNKEASEAGYTVLQSGSIHNEGGSMLSGYSVYISNRSSVDDIEASGVFNAGGRIEGSGEGFAQIISQGKIDTTEGSISGGNLYLQAKGDILYGGSRIVGAGSKSLQLIAEGGLYGVSSSSSLISGGQVILQAKQDILGNNAQIKAAADLFLSIKSNEGRVELGDSELAGGDVGIAAKGAADLSGSSVDALFPEGSVSLRSSEGDVFVDNGSVSGAQVYLQAERGSLSNVGGEIRASQFAVLTSGAASEKLMSDEDKQGIFTRVSDSLSVLRGDLSEVYRTTFDLSSIEPEEEGFTANVSGNISGYLSLLRSLAINEDLDESQKQAVGVAIEQLLDARSAMDAYGYAGLLDNTGGLIASEGGLHVMVHAGQKADGSIEGARILLDRGSLSASSDELFKLKVEGDIDLGRDSSISAGALDIQARTQTGGMNAELAAHANREQLAAIYAPLYGVEPEDLLGEGGAPDRVPLGLRMSVSDGSISVYSDDAAARVNADGSIKRPRIEGDGVSLNALAGGINVSQADLGRADSRVLSLVAKDDLIIGGASFSSDSISIESLTGDVSAVTPDYFACCAVFSAKDFVSIKAAGDVDLGRSALVNALVSRAVLVEAGGDIRAAAINVRASSDSYFRAIAGGAIDIDEADLVIGSGLIHAKGGDLLMGGENASLLALSSQGSLELKAGSRGYRDAERYTEIFKGLESEIPESEDSEDEQVSILSLLSALDGESGVSIDYPSQSEGSSQKEAELTIRIALGDDEESGEAVFTESSFREDAEAFFSKLIGILSFKAQVRQLATAVPEEEVPEEEAPEEEAPEEEAPEEEVSEDEDEEEYWLPPSYEAPYSDTEEESEKADPLVAAIAGAVKGLEELQKTIEVVGGGKIDLSEAAVSGDVSILMESIGDEEGIVADDAHISASPAQSVRLVSGGRVSLNDASLSGAVIEVSAVKDIAAQGVEVLGYYGEERKAVFASEKGSVDLSRAYFTASEIKITAGGGDVLSDDARIYGESMSLRARDDISAANALISSSAGSASQEQVDIGGFSLISSEGAVTMRAGQDIRAEGLNVRGLSAFFSATAGGSMNINNSDVSVNSAAIRADDGDLFSKDAVLHTMDLLLLQADGSFGYKDSERYTEVFGGGQAGEQDSIVSLLSLLAGEDGISVDELSDEEGGLAITILMGDEERPLERIFTEASFREDAEGTLDRLIGLLLSKKRAAEERISDEENSDIEISDEEIALEIPEGGSVSDEEEGIAAVFSEVIEGLGSLKSTLEVVQEGGVDVSGSILSAGEDLLVLSKGPGERGVAAVGVNASTTLSLGESSVFFYSVRGDIDLSGGILSSEKVDLLIKDMGDLLLEDSSVAASRSASFMAGDELRIGGANIYALDDISFFSKGSLRGGADKKAFVRSGFIDITTQGDIDLRNVNVAAYGGPYQLESGNSSEEQEGAPHGYGNYGNYGNYGGYGVPGRGEEDASPANPRDLPAGDLPDRDLPAERSPKALKILSIKGNIFAGGAHLSARGISMQAIGGTLGLDEAQLDAGADYDLRLFSQKGIEMNGLNLTDARNVEIKTEVAVVTRTIGGDTENAVTTIEADAINARGANLSYRGIASFKGGDMGLEGAEVIGGGVSIETTVGAVDITGAVLKGTQFISVEALGDISAEDSRLTSTALAGSVRLSAKEGAVKADNVFIEAGLVYLNAQGDIELGDADVRANAARKQMEEMGLRESALSVVSSEGSILARGMNINSNGVFFDAEGGGVDLTGASIHNHAAYQFAIVARDDIRLEELGVPLTAGDAAIVSEEGWVHAAGLELEYRGRAWFEGAKGVSLAGADVRGGERVLMRASSPGAIVDVSNARVEAGDAIVIDLSEGSIDAADSAFFIAGGSGIVSFLAGGGDIKADNAFIEAGLVYLNAQGDVGIENADIRASAAREQAAEILGVTDWELDDNYRALIVNSKEGRVDADGASLFHRGEAYVRGLKGISLEEGVVRGGEKITFSAGLRDKAGAVIHAANINVDGAYLDADDSIFIESAGGSIFAAESILTTGLDGAGSISLLAREGTVDFGDPDADREAYISSGLVSIYVHDDIDIGNVHFEASGVREQGTDIFGASDWGLETPHSALTIVSEYGDISGDFGYEGDGGSVEAAGITFKAENGSVFLDGDVYVEEGYQLTIGYRDELYSDLQDAGGVEVDAVVIELEGYDPSDVEAHDSSAYAFEAYLNGYDPETDGGLEDYADEWAGGEGITDAVLRDYLNDYDSEVHGDFESYLSVRPRYSGDEYEFDEPEEYGDDERLSYLYNNQFFDAAGFWEGGDSVNYFGGVGMDKKEFRVCLEIIPGWVPLLPEVSPCFGNMKDEGGGGSAGGDAYIPRIGDLNERGEELGAMKKELEEERIPILQSRVASLASQLAQYPQYEYEEDCSTSTGPDGEESESCTTRTITIPAPASLVSAHRAAVSAHGQAVRELARVEAEIEDVNGEMAGLEAELHGHDGEHDLGNTRRKLDVAFKLIDESAGEDGNLVVNELLVSGITLKLGMELSVNFKFERSLFPPKLKVDLYVGLDLGLAGLHADLVRYDTTTYFGSSAGGSIKSDFDVVIENAELEFGMIGLFEQRLAGCSGEVGIGGIGASCDILGISLLNLGFNFKALSVGNDLADAIETGVDKLADPVRKSFDFVKGSLMSSLAGAGPAEGAGGLIGGFLGNVGKAAYDKGKELGPKLLDGQLLDQIKGTAAALGTSLAMEMDLRLTADSLTLGGTAWDKGGGRAQVLNHRARNIDLTYEGRALSLTVDDLVLDTTSYKQSRAGEVKKNSLIEIDHLGLGIGSFAGNLGPVPLGGDFPGLQLGGVSVNVQNATYKNSVSVGGVRRNYTSAGLASLIVSADVDVGSGGDAAVRSLHAGMRDFYWNTEKRDERGVLRNKGIKEVDYVGLSARELSVAPGGKVGARNLDLQVRGLHFVTELSDTGGALREVSILDVEGASLNAASVDLERLRLGGGGLGKERGVEEYSHNDSISGLAIDGGNIVGLKLDFWGVSSQTMLYNESFGMEGDIRAELGRATVSADTLDVEEFTLFNPFLGISQTRRTDSVDGEKTGVTGHSYIGLTGVEGSNFNIILEGLEKSEYTRHRYAREEYGDTVLHIDVVERLGRLILSSEKGEGSQKGSMYMADARLRGFTFSMPSLEKFTERYDDTGAVRESAYMSMDDLLVSAGQINVQGLGSVSSNSSDDYMLMWGAELTNFDLSMGTQYSRASRFDEGGVEREWAASGLESLTLDASRLHADLWGSLSSEEGEGEYEHEEDAELLLIFGAELTSFNLDIIGQETAAKLRDKNDKLREDTSADVDSLSLSIVQADVGMLGSVSRDEGDGEGLLVITNAEFTSLDLGLIGQETAAKLYDEGGTLREDTSGVLNSLLLSIAGAKADSLKSASGESGSSALEISGAELTSLDLNIIGQDTASKAYDGGGELRAESVSSLDSLLLSIAGGAKADSLKSASDVYGSSSLEVSGAELASLDLNIIGQTTASKAYDGGGELRAESVSILDSLLLSIAGAKADSLESVSDVYGSSSALTISGAELASLDLNIIGQTTASKAYDGGGELRAESVSILDSLLLSIAGAKADSLESVSDDYGSGSALTISGAELASLDLNIIGQTTASKAYDGGGELRAESVSILDSLLLSMAGAKADSLESVSDDYGSGSALTISGAELASLDLNIIGQTTASKAYDGGGELRAESVSILDSLLLSMAGAKADSLESVSDDYGSGSALTISGAELASLDLNIIGQTTASKAYDGGGELRAESVSILDSLLLSMAGAKADSLESVSDDYGSGSALTISGAELASLDLNIIGQTTASKAYDGGGELRAESVSILDSLLLSMAGAKADSLESVSDDYGSGSALTISGAELASLDLNIIGQTTASKAYDGGGELRAESVSVLERLLLSIAGAKVGSLESVSDDYGSGSALTISDAELTGLDLNIIGQDTASKAYDGDGELRAESVSSLERLLLSIAGAKADSLKSASDDYGSSSTLEISGAELTGLDLNIIGQDTASKAYDGDGELRAESVSSLERLLLSIAGAKADSLKSASDDYGSSSTLEISGAELTSLDLNIIGQDTASKAYDGDGELRAESVSSLERLLLSIAGAKADSLKSASDDYGSSSTLEISGAELTGLDLNIIGQDTVSKAYDANAVLRAEGSSSLESLSLSIAGAKADSLKSASGDYGSSSTLEISGAELTGLDLDIIGQDTKSKAYDANAVLRAEGSSSLESLSLSIAGAKADSLKSASDDYGSSSTLEISGAELTSLDLNIIGQDTASKAYDGDGELRAESVSSLERLLLSIAGAKADSLKSASDDYGSSSTLEISGAELTGLDLNIIGQDTVSKAYDANAVLRAEGSSSLESLSLSIAGAKADSLKSASGDYGSSSTLEISGAELTGLDLDIIGQDTKSKAYDANAVLRAEGSSSLESLSLSIAQAKVGSLESVSNDYGSGSALTISDAELTSLDLEIKGQTSASKAYDANAVLRAEGSSSLESLSLSIAQAKVGSLESVSNDYGSGSALTISDAELTSLDLEIKGQTSASKAYDANAVLRAEGSSSLESLSLSIAQAKVGSLESVSDDYGSGSALRISDAELTSLDLEIKGQTSASKAYDANAVLRAEGSSSLESLSLSIAQAKVGSLESVSNDYGSGSALTISDAELTSLDLEIKGQTSASKAYDANAVLRAEGSSSLESLSLSIAQAKVGSLESVSNDYGSGSALTISDAELTSLDLEIKGQTSASKAYDANAVLRAEGSSSLESLSLSIAQAKVGSLESVSNDYGSGSALTISDAELTSLDLEIKGQTSASKAYDANAVLRAEGSSSLESLSLSIAQAKVGSLESVSNDYGSGSALRISDAELTSLDLEIKGQTSASKAYDANAVLRAEGSSSLESLSLTIAQAKVGSLESVSDDYGSGSVLTISDAELTSLDLDIKGQTSASKAYDANAVLRAEGSSSLESLSLSIAQAKVGSLESVSNDYGSGSALTISDAELTSLDLDIKGQTSASKAYDANAVLRAEGSSSLESLSLSIAQAKVGSLESVSDDYGSGSVLTISDAELTSLDLEIKGQTSASKAYDANAVLRAEGSSSLESLSLSIAQAKVGSLESVSDDYGSGSVLRISDAELTSLDLDIKGQTSASKAYDANAVLRAEGSSSLESLSLSIAQAKVGSLESVSDDYGSGSALTISDAELTSLDLEIKGQTSASKAYDANAVLRAEGSSSLESLSLSIAQAKVGSLESVSDDYGSGSVLRISDAELTSLDLDIKGQTSASKAYDANAVLRAEGSSSLESLSLSIAQAKVGSLESVSNDYGSGSALRISDAELTSLDLEIKGQTSASKAYDANAVLRAEGSSSLESLSLSIAQAKVGSLESVSNDYGSGSALRISDAELTSLDLEIKGQTSASKAYDANAVLRAEGSSSLESLSLSIAQAKVGSLESVSNDYGSGSALRISDAELTSLDLDIKGQTSASKAYDANAVLRAEGSSSLESLSLSIAQAKVGSLESVSNDYGSGSALRISDAELTSLDLDIKGQTSASKAYDANAVLRAEGSSSLESLSLSIAQAKVGSLESVSDDYGSGSVLRISDAELTSLDLDIKGQTSASKAYDANAVLRAEGSSSLESLSLSIAQAKVGSLESVSDDYGSGSVLRISDAELTSLDLDIKGQTSASKAYDANAVLRAEGSSSLESLSLSIAQAKVGSLESVSNDYGSGSVLTISDAELTSLDLDIKGQTSASKAYDANAVLRAEGSSSLESLSLSIAQAKVGSLESVSNDYGSGSVLTISDAELTSLDLDIKGQTSASKAYDANAVLRAEGSSSLESLSLSIAQAKVGSLESVSDDYGSGSVLTISDAELTSLDLEIKGQTSASKAYDANAVLRAEGSSSLESLSLSIAQAKVGSLESVSNDYGSGSVLTISDAELTSLDLDIKGQTSASKAYDANAVLRAEGSSSLESLSLSIAQAKVGSLESVSNDYGSGSVLTISDAELTSLDLDIKGQTSASKAYDANAVLRAEGSSSLESLSLSIAQAKVGSLESVSDDYGSGSVLTISDAELTSLDLEIKGQTSASKAYDANAVLRAEGSSSLESLSLSIAQAKVGSLESVSNDYGSGSVLTISDAELTSLDLEIKGQTSASKAYDANAVLRAEGSSSLESLSLSIAQAKVGSLESVSDDYGSGSALRISDAELTSLDLDIKGQTSASKAYDANAVLRAEGSSSLESLSLSIAQAKVGSLESVSNDYGSGSVLTISDAELTSLDLDIKGQTSASKAYDANAVLRAEGSSSLESLSLSIAQAKVGSLESVSNDYGSGSVLTISDAELTSLDLDIKGQTSASKAYDANAVLRAEGSSSLESLSLSIAQAKVGSLESVSTTTAAGVP